MKSVERRSEGVLKLSYAVELVAKAIIDGKYSAGTFLPSEHELGRITGVSRSVIRETIRRLGAAGLVETRHGIGTYVKPSSEWNLFDPLLLRAFVESGNLPAISRELVELRTMVEVESAGMAARRADAKQRSLLQQWLQQMEVGVDDIETFIRADVAFHNAVIASTENRFLIQITKYLTDPIIEARRLTTIIGGGQERRAAQRWHREIYHAICNHDPQGAADAMRQHMVQLEELINRALLMMTPED